ncbi:hypothetical protein HanPSC8_Chr11g0466301 [Helianthus annuus]|nr:hypothetical protein HanPSC8_Chr11g0466301 [Helianthus annuus]
MSKIRTVTVGVAPPLTVAAGVTAVVSWSDELHRAVTTLGTSSSCRKSQTRRRIQVRRN